MWKTISLYLNLNAYWSRVTLMRYFVENRAVLMILARMILILAQTDRKIQTLTRISHPHRKTDLLEWNKGILGVWHLLTSSRPTYELAGYLWLKPLQLLLPGCSLQRRWNIIKHTNSIHSSNISFTLNWVNLINTDASRSDRKCDLFSDCFARVKIIQKTSN